MRVLHRVRARLRGLAGYGLILVGGVAVCAAIAAVTVAITSPAQRAGAMAESFAAIASTIGVLAALYLSRQTLLRTDRELAATHRSVVLSRYPLILPIHQSVAFPESSGVVAQHPPAEERFELTSAPAPAYAFLAVARDRLLIPVENVGEGPALRIRGMLWCSDGRSGRVAGVPALGVGRTGVMTTIIESDGQPLPQDFRDAIVEQGSPALAYWLDIEYVDVFANARRTAAIFDPRGVGTWHYMHGHESGTV